MTNELRDAAIDCEKNPLIRAVLISAKGKMFCAGGDLNDFSKAGEDVSLLAKQMTSSLHTAISRFARMRAPMVCAVNGSTAGGGMSLVLVADIVLATESARFTMAYTRTGLVPDGSSTHFLPRVVGAPSSP